MGTMRTKRKSWRYTNTLTWREGKKGVLASEGKPDLEVATPADFGGPEGTWTPEDLLVASVNSCIMTTFLYHHVKAGVALVSYNSAAEGELVYDEQGLRFAEIRLRPQVVVASQADREKAERALERAEQTCLISNALECPVIVKATVKVASGPEDARVP